MATSLRSDVLALSQDATAIALAKTRATSVEHLRGVFTQSMNDAETALANLQAIDATNSAALGVIRQKLNSPVAF